MKLLVTGAAGFLGKNLVKTLETQTEHSLVCYDIDTPHAVLEEAVKDCDFVFHLAGVNRPEKETAFMQGNRDALTELIALLEQAKNPVPVLLSSSIQAALDNPYGRSKRAGEEALFAYGNRNGVPVYPFRFPNLFGKWSRPFYNSAIATFCYNAARGKALTIIDPDAPLRLLYVDQAVEAMLSCLDGTATVRDGFVELSGVHQTTVEWVARTIAAFTPNRNKQNIPDMGDTLTKQLYATYLSFLPAEDFARPLVKHADSRGSFTELLHSPDRGQVSVNISKPGITKGNHWHHTKNEKFIVVAGEALIRFRHAVTGETVEYRVSGENPTSVDIPTGWSHSIENIGTTELITVMWANECFDPKKPDTYFMPV